jgi:hypothetical protein
MWVLLITICLKGDINISCDVNIHEPYFKSEKECSLASKKEFDSWQVKENIQWLEIQSRHVNCVKIK